MSPRRRNKPGRREAPPGRIRIIGGRWRGRKLEVPAAPALRPTPDRVRETLFNWIAPQIEGARCLDLFAGTGVLGFEALSRGASAAVMVEQDPALVDRLRVCAAALDAEGAEIVHADGLAFLDRAAQPWDIIFLDPPFGSGLAAEACKRILNRGHLAPGGVIYVESGPGFRLPDDSFTIIRESSAGQVRFMLLEAAGGSS